MRCGQLSDETRRTGEAPDAGGARSERRTTAPLSPCSLTHACTSEAQVGMDRQRTRIRVGETGRAD